MHDSSGGRQIWSRASLTRSDRGRIRGVQEILGRGEEGIYRVICGDVTLGRDREDGLLVGRVSEVYAPSSAGENVRVRVRLDLSARVSGEVERACVRIVVGSLLTLLAVLPLPRVLVSFRKERRQEPSELAKNSAARSELRGSNERVSIKLLL